MQDNYQKQLEEVIKELNTNTKTGLTTKEVKKRQAEYGSNELQQKKKRINHYSLLYNNIYKVLH